MPDHICLHTTLDAPSWPYQKLILIFQGTAFRWVSRPLTISRSWPLAIMRSAPKVYIQSLHWTSLHGWFRNSFHLPVISFADFARFMRFKVYRIVCTVYWLVLELSVAFHMLWIQNAKVHDKYVVANLLMNVLPSRFSCMHLRLDKRFLEVAISWQDCWWGDWWLHPVESIPSEVKILFSQYIDKLNLKMQW